MTYSDELRAQNVAASPHDFIYHSSPEAMDRDELPGLLTKILADADFEPLFSEATLREVRDFQVLAPDEGVDIDFARSYEKLLSDPDRPHAGAVVGIGAFGDIKAVVFASQWVRGAAVGEVEGELMVQSFKYAMDHNLPHVMIPPSGGMDQSQGPMALLQMPRMTTAMEMFKAASNQPSVVIHLDPTMGGTSASVAFNGDVTVAAGERTITGFTGKRVQDFVSENIEKDPMTKLRPVDQSAVMSMLNNNGIEVIIQPDEIHRFVTHYLEVATTSSQHELDDSSPSARELIVAAGSVALESAREALRHSRVAHAREARVLPLKGSERIVPVTSRVYKRRNPISRTLHRDEHVVIGPRHKGPEEDRQLSNTERWRRDHERHTGTKELDHIDTLLVLDHGFDSYQLLRNPLEFSGRIHFENIITAQAKIDGRPVVVIGHQSDHELIVGANGNTELTRKYSQPRPQDWARVTRAVEVAERRDIPVITLLDSPGAASNRAAEAGGQAMEMSRALGAISRSRVPVLTYVTGSAGSGGAICMASIAPQPRALDTASIFVAAPLASAAIYKKQPDPDIFMPPSGGLISAVADAAQVGADAWVGTSRVFRDIIPTQADPRDTAEQRLRPAIIEDLDTYGSLRGEELTQLRMAALAMTAQNVQLTPAT